MLIGGLQAGVVLFAMMFTLEGESVDHNGQPTSLWVTGTLTYGIIIIIVNLKIFFQTSAHTYLSILVQLGSVGIFFLSYYGVNFASWVPQL